MEQVKPQPLSVSLGGSGGGTTQAFQGVLPLPNPPGTVPPIIGATAASEAPTVVGNLAGAQRGATAASEAPTVISRSSGSGGVRR